MYPSMAQAEGFDAGRWQGQQAYDAQRNNVINQQNSLQELYKNQQMLPLDMANKVSTTELNNANAGHARALTANSIFDLDVKQRLKEPTYLKALSDLSSSTTENEVKQAHAQLEKDMLSPDPQVSKLAQQRYKMTGDMLKMYEHLRIQGENSKDVARSGAQSRVDAVVARGAGGSGAPRSPTSLESQLYFYNNVIDNPESTRDQVAKAQTRADLVKEMIANRGFKAPAMVWDNAGKLVPNPDFGAKPVPQAGKPVDKAALNTPENIAHTAKLYNMTEAQVKAQLGIK
jgi:hypothetical protein